MKYLSSKKFDRNFGKLPKKIKKQCIKRMEIFIQNPFDPILNNHRLTGGYENYRSINITGDIRAIYESRDELALFVRIGSHSELYK